MTEHRPSYQAFSGNLQTHPALRRPVTLEQQYTDGTTSRDTLLLLPILDTSVSDKDATPPVCMHLVHLGNGALSLCNSTTIAHCPCCGLSMCAEHRSSRSIALPDETGIHSEQAPLCETCSHLPLDILLAVYIFRTRINQIVQACPSELDVMIEEQEKAS